MALAFSPWKVRLKLDKAPGGRMKRGLWEYSQTGNGIALWTQAHSHSILSSHMDECCWRLIKDEEG